MNSAWFTVKVCPAMVSVPVRGASAGFNATVNVTLPAPVPLVAEVNSIHAFVFTAVHAQMKSVRTFAVREPPVKATLVELVFSAYVQSPVTSTFAWL